MYLVTIFDGVGDEQGTVIHTPYTDKTKLSSGNIDLGIEGISSFNFTINLNNPAWNKIKPLTTLVQVLDVKRNVLVFNGRVLKPVQKMTSNGSFTTEYICEDKLAYLNDSSQRHGEYRDMTVKEFFEVMIDNHNRQVEPHKQFIVGNVTVTTSTDNIYRYLGYNKTFAEIKDNLIDRLGGYLKLREEPEGTYIDYLESVGELKNTPIRLRTNLKEMQKEVDPTNIITRLVPLGTRIESEDETATDASQARLSIAEVNNGLDYIDDDELIQEFGVIEDSMTWDDINVPSILLTRGNQFLQDQKTAKASYDVTPVDVSLIDANFESFEVGNWYNVDNPVLAIDEPLQIIGKQIDILNPQASKLTIGEKQLTLSDYQVDANKSARKVVDLENIVSNQSARIGNLVQHINNVDAEMSNVLQIIAESDLEELPDAINALEQAITDLNDALDGIPIYDVATHTEDGLMASADKVRLDSLQVYEEATEIQAGLMTASDKQKLNRITVTQNIDLDDVLTRLQALEGPQ